MGDELLFYCLDCVVLVLLLLHWCFFTLFLENLLRLGGDFLRLLNFLTLQSLSRYRLLLEDSWLRLLNHSLLHLFLHDMKGLRPKTSSILGHVDGSKHLNSFFVIILDFRYFISAFENRYNVSFFIIKILPLHDFHQYSTNLLKKLPFLPQQHL